MKKNLLLLVSLAFLLLGTIGCQQFENVPPNDIGMMLTPTGYEEKIYTPGQVDIGQESNYGRGNQLVLLQRSGIEVKEAFSNADATKEDHRCLTSEREPITLDVRLLFALPNRRGSKCAVAFDRCARSTQTSTQHSLPLPTRVKRGLVVQ